MSDEGRRAWLLRWRRQWQVLMLSVVFAGGMLAGIVVSAAGVPAGWLPVVVLVAVGLFVLVLRPGL